MDNNKNTTPAKIKEMIITILVFIKKQVKKWTSIDNWKEYFIPEDPKEHPRLVRFLFLTLSILLITTGLVFLISFIIVKSKTPTVRMPSLENKDIVEAINLLQSEKLTAHFEMVFDENNKKYQVIKQTPSKGASIKEGRAVFLIVSLGEDLYKVPQLCGMIQQEAISILDENNIPYLIQIVPPGKKEIDRVIALNFPVNTKVSRDTPLIMTVTDEILANQYRVDDFIRKPLEFAANTLYNNRIVPIIITTNVSSLSDDGLVLEQNINEGEILMRNSSIILTVGSYAYDEGEKENMRWHVLNYYIPKIDGFQEQNIITNEDGTISDLSTGEQHTAQFYKAVVEDELGRPRTIYERLGAEGSSFIRVFKSYGATKVYIYADNDIIGSRDYGQ